MCSSIYLADNTILPIAFIVPALFHMTFCLLASPSIALHHISHICLSLGDHHISHLRAVTDALDPFQTTHHGPGLRSLCALHRAVPLLRPPKAKLRCRSVQLAIYSPL